MQPKETTMALLNDSHTWLAFTSLFSFSCPFQPFYPAVFPRATRDAGGVEETVFRLLMSTLSNKQAVNLQFDSNMNSHIPTRATVTS